MIVRIWYAKSRYEMAASLKSADFHSTCKYKGSPCFALYHVMSALTETHVCLNVHLVCRCCCWTSARWSLLAGVRDCPPRLRSARHRRWWMPATGCHGRNECCPPTFCWTRTWGNKVSIWGYMWLILLQGNIGTVQTVENSVLLCYTVCICSG